MLKNQATLSWLYGQSLDEAEVREHALNRFKTGSPRPPRGERITIEQRKQRELLRDWAAQHGEPHAKRMLENYQRVMRGYQEGCDQFRREQEEIERERLEQERLAEEEAELLRLAEEQESIENAQSPMLSKSRNSSPTKPEKIEKKKKLSNVDRKKTDSLSVNSSFNHTK